MQVVRTRRWALALAILARAEHKSAALPASIRWRPLTIAGATAHGAQVPPGLPHGRREPDVPVRRVWAPVSANVVQVGKFDVGRQVRLRGFYADDGVSIRLQAASRSPDARHGVGRSVHAAQVVGRHRPGLAPRLVDHGRLAHGRTAYLVEEIVRGKAPRGRAEVREAMVAIARELQTVHHAVGIEHHRLSAVVAPNFLKRWQRLVVEARVDAPLAEAVDRLVARDALLEVSFGHGDLVSSNVLLADGGITLIDWEYAGRQPIAFDLAKIHVNAGSITAATQELDAALAGTVGHDRDHYSLAEQLALAHVVVLSRFEARFAKAQVAGRLTALERHTRRRAEAVRRLLAIEA